MTTEHISDSRFRTLIDTRASAPEKIAEAAGARRTRSLLSAQGKLFIVAADHPARGALKAGDEKMAMADRRRLLERAMIALSLPGVDGILGSPDVIEDLLLLDALHDKIAVGTMNRGGLAGSSWELDDPFTAYDAATIERMKLDGGKMLLRIDYSDAGSLRTIEGCSRAVTSLAERKFMAMIEVLPAKREGNTVTVLKDPDALATAMCVASGLGVTSAYSWLKIPVVAEMDRVMTSTTLPTLLLGGDPGSRAAEVFAGWKSALAIPQVRGLVAGRALLFPPGGDVSRAVSEAAAIVHGA
jgi:hypothetical protein